MNGEIGRNMPHATVVVATAASDRGEGGNNQGAQDGLAREPSPRDELEARIMGLEKEKNENWDRYLRTAADLENLRRRQKREMEDVRLESLSEVLREILPTADSLERVIDHAIAQAGTHPLVEGVLLVLRQFLTALERLDVTQIGAAGQPFNPNLHEAISQQETNGPSGMVVQVLQRGYKSGDRLLRPALVVVSKTRTAPSVAE
jgi:molecular chaperone GrpE